MKKVFGSELSFIDGEDTLLPPGPPLMNGSAAKPADPVIAPSPFGKKSDVGQDGAGPVGGIVASLSVDAAFAAAAADAKSGILQKLDSQLAALYYSQSADAVAMKAFTDAVVANPNAITPDGAYVTIDAAAVDGDGAALLTALNAIGLIQGASFNSVASGLLPVDKVADLLAISNLAMARQSFLTTDVGAVTSQGDLSMHADTARTAAGVDGTGIKIGILSDSFDTATGASTHKAQDIASNDLPASVTILQDQASGTDEGRAMAQLIHDSAPGSPILFATASGGVANFANNVTALANAGAKVIVDDANTLETWFQDSPISQAIDQFVANGGVYFTSAGNRDHWGYESQFINGGTGQLGAFTETFHNFGTTVAGVQSTLLKITQTTTTFYEFEWADPAASVSPGVGATFDIDLAEYANPDGTGLIASQTSSNTGADPIETFTISGATTFYLRIGKFSGGASGPVDMKIVPFPSGGSVTYGANTSNVNDGTVHGHHAAAGAISVAAAAFYQTPAFSNTTPVVESFSSGGPANVWFDTAGHQLAAAQVRQVPTVTAPDGGNTTFFGGDIPQDTDTFPNFFGTSAAAPEAAAVAALMLQARSTLTPAGIRNALQNTAIDMDNPATAGFDIGYDYGTGAGLIQADRVVVPSSVAINDASITEGNSGTKVETFTVTRSGGPAAFDVNFATADSSAKVADNDYVANSGTLHFGTGVNTQTVSVTVNGDTKFELKESFLVNLSGATNGVTISDGQGVGTIKNDDFNSAPGHFDSAGIWTSAGNGSDNTWHVGDFNGDGKDDIFRYLSGGEQVFLSNGSSFAFNGVWSPAGNGSDNQWHVGDFNGDGKDDIFRYIEGSGDQTFLSNGSSFVFDSVWTPAGPGSDGTWHVGDFNGDGKADVFRTLNGEDVFLSDGTKFVHSSVWSPAGSGSDGQWYIGDFNGDGKDDIFRQIDGSGAQMFLSNGTSFVFSGVWTPAGTGSDGTWHLGDFNGDGKTDIFRYLAGSGADVFLSNGSSFVHDASWTPAGIGTDNQWYVGDFNGDGAADIFRQLSGADMFLSHFG